MITRPAPLRIGLTGGVGSGKTTACGLFSELGVPVIDADQIAHQLTKQGQPATRAIMELFGQKAFTATGELDRAFLRQQIFDDVTARQRLEGILHPLIYAEINRQVALLKTRYCIIAIPLLIETHTEDRVDRILAIDVPEQQQLQRASLRDGTDSASITKIMNSQVSRQQRLGAADDIIHNEGDIESLRLQVRQLHNFYQHLASGDADNIN